MEETSSISEDERFEGVAENEDNADICNEDLPNEEDSLSQLEIEEHDRVEADDSEVDGEEKPSILRKCNVSYEVKLRELLQNLCSVESKIYSEASKEFIRLLRGDSGREMLYQYIQASPSCVELTETWKLRQGKPGMAHIMSVISAILDHPDGKYHANDLARITISRRLDKFARMIIESKLGDVYTELNSREVRRQNAALLLMAVVVRRGLGLASEVAKNFDFKLAVFPKLAEVHHKKGGKPVKFFTRPAFIEFAMSFLEVGNPRLLRWILQQKDMYSGVLRGLGSDSEKTIVYVLSTLRDKVLTVDSLVPPGLRSVLFGGVTLEQLNNISGNPVGGLAAEMSHNILLMVCTDPCNGLMPDLASHTNPLKGNPKRLLELMKKLRGTEIGYHRDLLLAIVNGRPSLASAYMDEFPYILEPRASPLWFAAISLAAELISSVNIRLPFTLMASKSHDPPHLDSLEMQCILKCIIPRTFTRLVINRGLLHSDILVKHGSLRLLLEALNSLDSLIAAMDNVMENTNVNQPTVPFVEGMPKLNGLPEIHNLVQVDKLIDANIVDSSCTDNPAMQKWESLKQGVQDEVRALLPDPQVLLKLLSSLNYSRLKNSEMGLKRARASDYIPEVHYRDGVKKFKSDSVNENIDILIAGVNSELSNSTPVNCEKGKGLFDTEEMDIVTDQIAVIAGLWGLQEPSKIGNELKDAESYFHSKLLDALTFYLRIMPTALEGVFDFFKILPSNPMNLSINQQQSLFSLLIAYIGQSPRSRVSMRAPELMHKNLQPLINLMIYSPIKDIQDKAYVLARAAMLSTGAFDRNPSEIDAWFLFLPGYRRDNGYMEDQGTEIFRNFSVVIFSFFCDAVSTIGNNLYKYLDQMRCLISKLEDFEVVSPSFSCLVICILQKCLRLLDSDSGTFKLSERSMISIYVCNTLCLILQTQVEVGLLSAVIDLVLTEKLEEFSPIDADAGNFLCEWRPLKNLLLFVRSTLHQWDCCSLYSITERTMSGDGGSLLKTLAKVNKVIKSGHGGGLVEVATAFSSSIICATPDDILKNFPLLITVAQHLFGPHLSFLSSILFLEWNLLPHVANLWPNIFFSGLEMAGVTTSSNYRKDYVYFPMGDMAHRSVTEAVTPSKDLESTEAASIAFSLFMKHSPFHALFPAITSIESSNILGSTNILEFLRAKLSEVPISGSIASLRLVLFWVHQIQSSHRTKPSCKLEQLLEICFILIDHMLVRLLVVSSESDSSNTIRVPSMTTHIHEVAEFIFLHPAVIVSLSFPLCCNEKLTNESLGDSLEDFLSLSKQSIHSVDHNILHLVKRVADFMLAVRNDQGSAPNVHDSPKPAVKAFKHVVQRSFFIFREKFDMCNMVKDLMPLFPSFYIFHSLMCYISPFELLELVQWMFIKIDQHGLTGWSSTQNSALSIALYIADSAFDMLTSFFRQRTMETVAGHMYWELEGRKFDFSLLEKVYYKIIEFATCFTLESADLCLQKVVNAVYGLKFMQPKPALLPLSMAMLRMVSSSPMKLLTHLICKTSKTKAKALFQLTEVSSLHSGLFGQILLCILNKDLLSINGNCNYNLSDEELMLLLPAALSYLTSHSIKYGNQYLEIFGSIPSFYSRILLNGFSNWKSYVSGKIFEEAFNEFVPTTMEELLSLLNSSLLGKAIHMLRYYFSFNGNLVKKKKRMRIFNSIYPLSVGKYELLDCDISEINFSSFEQSLNFINRVVGKIYFSRLLLFPQDNLIQLVPVVTDEFSEGMPLEKRSNTDVSVKLRFMNILVNSLDMIVKRFPLDTDSSKKSHFSDCFQFKYLEQFILRNIVQLTIKMQSDLIQLHSIPFLIPFTRSSFLHRFEDPTTLKAIRNIFLLLSEGKFSSGDVFELLLAHSQFIPTILWNHSLSDSYDLSHTGTLLRPISSILKVFVGHSTDRNAAYDKRIHGTSSEYKRKLEVVKLLRVLYLLKAHQCSTGPGKDAGMNSRELLSLLLSGYGATLSEIDLEIFHLMHDIESIDGGSIAEMDYLWGSSASKIRREQTLEKLLLSSSIADCEPAEERRKRQFRENIPVDSKLCVMTVLHFCYDRVASTGPTSLKKLQQDDFRDMPETSSANLENMQQYDPAFILSFSIHGLSMGYIESLEFVGLGLLAVAFVSISSPDEGIRKLGYEVLGRLKAALENCRNSKEGLRLRLLLTYLQNGIAEPWQKIPSVTAIFAAEASFILLDPSHDHFPTISKFLTRSPRADLKCVPLFHTLFGSNSIHFQTDRLWILRLSYAGLNLDDDAQIFKKKFMLELLLSFYTSSLSDHESKILILQIVKKSVKVHILACYLVEHCGLIPWLSSVLSFCGENLYGDQNGFYLSQMTTVIEVVNDIISLHIIFKWLQQHALEQLSEFSSHLHMLFIGGLKSLKENVALVNSILHILVSTLRISQKRKIYQPHFTLSIDGLFQLHQAIDNEFHDMSFGFLVELGLRTILMSTPPPNIYHMDSVKLSKLVTWAISTALQSNSTQKSLLNKADHLTILSEEKKSEDSLISKLLRWVTASVILGRISSISRGINASFPPEKSKVETLQSLLEHVKRQGQRWEDDLNIAEVLAANILYVQQLLGINCGVLPSVVSALCLLLLSDTTNLTEADPLDGNSSDFVASLCSKILCPAEANPAWRWSFYQPWKDLSSELTDLQKIEEQHACQTLLILFSNYLGRKKSSGLPVSFLTHRDVENSGLFTWERNIIVRTNV